MSRSCKVTTARFEGAAVPAAEVEPRGAAAPRVGAALGGI